MRKQKKGEIGPGRLTLHEHDQRLQIRGENCLLGYDSQSCSSVEFLAESLQIYADFSGQVSSFQY